MWKVLMRSWNEADHIGNSIKALLGSVDQIVVVDGGWAHFPYKHSPVLNKPYSVDGTQKIVKSFIGKSSTEVILKQHTTPFRSEYTGFNQYLQKMGKGGDYIFVIDPHEIIKGDILKQREIVEEEKWDIGYMAGCHTTLTDSSLIPTHYVFYSYGRIYRWHRRLSFTRRYKIFYATKSHDGKCKHIFFYHYTRNKEREFINDIFHEDFERFHNYPEVIYKYRKENNLEDGYTDLEIPERKFDPYVESGIQSME